MVRVGWKANLLSAPCGCFEVKKTLYAQNRIRFLGYPAHSLFSALLFCIYFLREALRPEFPFISLNHFQVY